MKLQSLVTAALITIIFSSCTSESSRQQTSPSATKTPNTKAVTIKQNIGLPIPIDSSDYVMYLLGNKNNDVQEYGSFKSSGRDIGYWNIIFYNVLTKESHLLDADKKMLITSYSVNSSSSDVDSYNDNITNIGKLIFYKIITTDYDKDGDLNAKDPEYLYVTDNNGRGFKQISPNGLQVISWKKIEHTHKVLIDTRADTNNDKSFDSDDEMTPYVYDLKTGQLEKVFNKAFVGQVSALFSKHWVKKEK